MKLHQKIVNKIDETSRLFVELGRDCEGCLHCGGCRRLVCSMTGAAMHVFLIS